MSNSFISDLLEGNITTIRSEIKITSRRNEKRRYLKEMLKMTKLAHKIMLRRDEIHKKILECGENKDDVE